MYTIKVYHNKELFASKTVYSLDRAIRTTRYVTNKTKELHGLKARLKHYGFRLVIVKE